MKKTLFLVCLSLISCVLFAQNKPIVQQTDSRHRIETYLYSLGEDSVRYTIEGVQDTLLTELFRKNGQFYKKSFRKDSTFFYDILERLAIKQYFFEGKNNDSTVYYYSDGTLSGTQTRRDSLLILKQFEKSGNTLTKIYEFFPFLHYTIQRDEKGRIRASKFKIERNGNDTFRFNYDTTYYAGNRIKSIEHNSFKYAAWDSYSFWNDNMNYEKQEYYSPDGQLLVAQIPDSLRLFPFKDNIDCYYGFKNRSGEVIISPRFDNVKRSDFMHFICDDGTNQVLMRLDGKIIANQKMQNIRGVYKDNFNGSYENNAYRETFMSSWRYRSYANYAFNVDDKYGLIDTLGHILLPPQYSMIQEYNPVFNMAYFQDNTKDFQVKREGIIDVATQTIVGAGRFPSVKFTLQKDFFIYADTILKLNKPAKKGLINRQGEVVLPASYLHIVDASTRLFWVYKTGQNDILNNDLNQLHKFPCGLFDAQNQKWLCEPIYYMVNTNYSFKPSKILYHREKKRCGVLDSAGHWLLPMAYDTIIQIASDKYITSIGGRYAIFDYAKQQLITQNYDCLIPFSPDYDDLLPNHYFLPNEYKAYFIAKKQGKWGVINQNDEIIVAFEYDYAGFEKTIYRGDLQHFVFLKGDSVYLFDKKYFPKPLPNNRLDPFWMDKDLSKWVLLDDETSLFVINKKMTVVIPPQYKIVSEYTYKEPFPTFTQRDIFVVENKEHKRQIVFSETGKMADFSFSEPLLWANPQSPIVFFGDNTQLDAGIKVGHLSSGKIIHNIKTGGVSIGDAQKGTYFVKNNVPLLPSKDEPLPYSRIDTLAIDDDGWLMFDAQGQQISKDTFRFPIPFFAGIGCGMVGEKWGLWQSDGKAIAPPQYESAVRDDSSGTFALFQNIGLNNWLVLFDKKGKQIVGTGRYDGISDYYDKYALVKKGDKVGLVDTFGREIIPISDLTNDNVNFMDSLNIAVLYAQKYRKTNDTIIRFGMATVVNRYFRNLPIQFAARSEAQNSPDSLDLPNDLRNLVWHKLLETQIHPFFQTVEKRNIKRSLNFKTYKVYTLSYSHSDYQMMRFGYNASTVFLYDLFVDNQNISFSLLKDSTDNAVYHNYRKEKGNWRKINAADVFNLTPENTLKINDLLVQKIRQLTDKDIDCGTSASFWERAKFHFLIKPKGIIFYFNTKVDNPKRRDGFYQIEFEKFFVPIEISWAELKPFLKG